MKISKIFHWLYFTVMMLPCVIIPIFAIYTRNENYNSNIEIEVQKNVAVDFNQLYESPKNNISALGLTFTNNNNGSWTINGSTNFTSDTSDVILDNKATNYYQNHIYVFGVKELDSQIQSVIMRLGNWIGAQPMRLYQCVSNETNNVFFNLRINKNSTFDNYILYPQIYDLTQMYGAGNEPSLNDFLATFTDIYYPYTTHEEKYISSSTITYNDTDVGSQFVYTLYNATDKYFNFDNFFGLNNVYSWIQLNWFSGNAPLGFAIFWHFFTYWLLASLAWLLFDVMIYVPLMIHRWMDKGAIE